MARAPACALALREQRLRFERSSPTEILRCTFNLSDRPAGFEPTGTMLVGTGAIGGGNLGPYAVVIEEIA